MHISILLNSSLKTNTSNMATDFGLDAKVYVHHFEKIEYAKSIIIRDRPEILFTCTNLLQETQIQSAIAASQCKWIVGIFNDSIEHNPHQTISCSSANEFIKSDELSSLVMKKIIELYLERKHVDAQINQQQQYIQHLERLSVFGELSASIIHDISSPLTILSSLVSNLKRLNRDMNKDLEELSVKFEKNINRIIDTTKTFRKMLQPNTNHSTQQFSPADVVREITDMLQSKFATKGIELRANLESAGRINMQGRPQEIFHALLNIVLNAIEAAYKTPAGWVQIDIIDHNNEIEFAISDSGKGIPPDIAMKMSKPFNTTKPNNQNLGIGFNIALKVVQRNGGRISICNKAANTKISIMLPKILDLNSHPSRAHRILVIDDQPEIVELITDELSQNGVKTFKAYNLNEAFLILQNEPLDAIISDILMPGGSGLDIYKWVREHKHHIRSYFITGHSLSMIEDSDLIAKEKIFTKPFNPEKITQDIMNELNQATFLS